MFGDLLGDGLDGEGRVLGDVVGAAFRVPEGEAEVALESARSRFLNLDFLLRVMADLLVYKYTGSTVVAHLKPGFLRLPPFSPAPQLRLGASGASISLLPLKMHPTPALRLRRLRVGVKRHLLRRRGVLLERHLAGLGLLSQPLGLLQLSLVRILHVFLVARVFWVEHRGNDLVVVVHGGDRGDYVVQFLGGLWDLLV